MLYVLVSDSSDNAKISIRDNATRADLTLALPAEHAAVTVIGRKEKKIVARYGFYRDWLRSDFPYSIRGIVIRPFEKYFSTEPR